MRPLDDIVAAYIKLRDKKHAIQKQHKEELRPINDKLEFLENYFLGQLNAQNAESIKTAEGTVYKHIRTSASVQDWDATLEYISATGAWDLLEKRISKIAVEERAEEGVAVPGVKLTREITTQVRRTK
jgi:hypothetical protein